MGTQKPALPPGCEPRMSSGALVSADRLEAVLLMCAGRIGKLGLRTVVRISVAVWAGMSKMISTGSSLPGFGLSSRSIAGECEAVG